MSSDIGKRLAHARRKAGFESASAAARALGMPVPTYSGHENGSRAPERETAQKYSRRFNVSLDWLLNGRDATRLAPTVPLVGFVGAEAAVSFYDGPFEEVPSIEGATDNTVAVEVRGDSLGSFWNGGLIYYDDVKGEMTSGLEGRPCVVGLNDGRVLVKKIKSSRSRGLWNLYGQFGEPIYDVEIIWCARVKNMVPR